MPNSIDDEQPSGGEHVDKYAAVEPAPSSSKILEADMDAGGVDAFQCSENPRKMSLEILTLRQKLTAMESQMSHLLGNCEDSTGKKSQSESQNRQGSQVQKDAADNPVVAQLLAELEAYKTAEQEAKAKEAQRVTEAAIRKDAEDATQRRMEHMRKAQEAANRAREEIERDARLKFQAEMRAAEEALKREAERRVEIERAAERAARERVEAERRAEEERKLQMELGRLRDKENAAIMGGETSKEAWRDIRVGRRARETKRRRELIQHEEKIKANSKAEMVLGETGKEAQEVPEDESNQTEVTLVGKDSTAGHADLDPEKANTVSKPQVLPKLNEVEWADFRATDGKVKDDHYAIDILMGEPSPWDEKPPTTATEKRGKNIENGEITTEKKMNQYVSFKGPLPERIRIRSKPILDLLWAMVGPPAPSTKYEPRVLVRPFKILALYDDTIRMLCEQSEDQDHVEIHVSTDEANNEQSSPPSEDSSAPEAASQDAKHHTQCLVQFMDGFIRPRLEYLSSSDCMKVYFSDIWYLFKPGDFVIGQGGRQVYRVLSVASTRHRATNTWRNYSDGFSKDAIDSEENPMHILCTHVDFDGKQLGPISTEFVIKKFDGVKAVESFEIYPANFDKNPSLREKFLKRGKEFLQAAATRHLYYAGLTLETKEEVDSQVVVDFEETFEAPGCENWRPDLETLIGTTALVPGFVRCEANCCRNDFILYDDFTEQDRDATFMNTLLPPMWTRSKLPSVAIYPRTIQESRNEENAITEDEFMIMSYRVFGFILRSRKWAKLDLECLKPIGGEENSQGEAETSFDQLILPPGHKDMVLSLITQHFRDKESATGTKTQVDMVRGKGKGLILLLHGAPGVGKTSTAECVAELFKKPLFQITCGDLGTTPKEVEISLERNFALANKWGCILLLDEADVFLARRTNSDFVRNGLVAVFLRVLEYYAGILFLTTNRVGDFDEAFASRIHISLHYPPLNVESTRAVFQVNFGRIRKRFQESGRQITIQEVDVCVYATDYWRDNPKARWNGRQIRNACQTALALAEFEAQGGKHEAIVDVNAPVNLEVSHFEVVVKAYLNFIKYLNDIYGTDADTRAKEAFLRATHKEGDFSGQENPLLVPPKSSWDRAGLIAPSQPSYLYGQQNIPARPPYQYSPGLPNPSDPSFYGAPQRGYEQQGQPPYGTPQINIGVSPAGQSPMHTAQSSNPQSVLHTGAGSASTAQAMGQVPYCMPGQPGLHSAPGAYHQNPLSGGPLGDAGQGMEQPRST